LIPGYRVNTVSSYNEGVQPLQLALLGTFHLATGEGVTINLATDKVRGLLAYLAVEANRPHRREALAALFWPDMPDQQARSNLRLSLHRLRQAIDDVAPGTSEVMLAVNRDVVQLQPVGLEWDHHRFQQALFACESHDHLALENCTDCLHHLETAAALYRGEFLAGFALDEGETFEDWLLIQREFLQQKALLAFHTLTHMHVRRGNLEAALHYAQRQLALDPLYEPAYQQAMRVQALNGRRPQALALYEQCRQLLADELGVEPDPQTTQLWQAIKDGRLQPAPTRPAQTERYHFPTPLTPFVGRQRELNDMMAALANPACRVLTLLGPGGMGKTRLSLQVGQQLTAASRLYQDGVYFIPLASVTAEDLLVTTIAQRLGLRLEEQTAPRRQLLAYLHDKEMLLVCDNVEQIAGAGPLLAEIVTAAPQVQWLVTSREPLNIQAEWRQLVGGLDVSGESSEAVELFQRSARRMMPNFHLRPADEAAVLELCRLVDGMPLALEIAAAWVRVMEPAAILGETRRSLDFLASPLQDVPERHQSVRAVLAQSWQLLAPHLQGILTRLALFPAAFSLEAARAILPDLTMLDVATLLDKSLLAGLPQGRYEIHELPRQFALSQPQPEKPAYQENYCRYYLALLAEQGAALRGRDPQAAVALIQAELEHVRQGWQWAVERQQMEALRPAVSSLARFYHLVGLFQEAQQRFVATIQRVARWPAAPDVTLLRCELHAGLSHFLGQSGQYESAIQHAQMVQQLAEPLDAVEQLAQAHCLAGEWHRHLSQFDEAQAHLQRALELYGRPAVTRQAAYALNEIGFIHLKQSQYPAALSAFISARYIYEALDDQTETSTTLGNIGYVYQVKGDYGLALNHLQQALAIAEAIGYQQGIVKHTLGLATVYWEQGDLAAAHAAGQKALQLAQPLGYLRGIINAQLLIGNAYTGQGELREAAHWYQKAHRQAEAAGVRDLLAAVISQQAMLCSHHGDYQAAIRHYEQAIQLWREVNNQTEMARTMGHLGNIYLSLNDYGKASHHYAISLEVAEAVGARQLHANALFKLGHLNKRLGHYEKALACCQQSLAINQAVGHRPGVTQSAGMIGLIYYEQGEYEAARRAYEQVYQLCQEIGDALAEAVWLSNLSEVNLYLRQYEAALAYGQQAIDQFRRLNSERYVAAAMFQQVEILLESQRVEAAHLLLSEAFRLEERMETEVLFNCRLLQARVWYALGQREEARGRLQTLLSEQTSPDKQALLHYRRWQMTGEAADAQTAITLYRRLLGQTPNHLYRKHLEQLEGGITR
jgi:DNA-binding SARP family transcriptional activator/predicted ATPase